jgi:hypothetical protein
MSMAKLPSILPIKSLHFESSEFFSCTEIASALDDPFLQVLLASLLPELQVIRLKNQPIIFYQAMNISNSNGKSPRTSPAPGQVRLSTTRLDCRMASAAERTPYVAMDSYGII